MALSPALEIVDFPELIFGIAGPIGVDIPQIVESLTNALRDVGYSTEHIRVTNQIDAYESDIKKPDQPDFYSEIKYKMDHASCLCRVRKDEAFCARASISAIRQIRLQKGGKEDAIQSKTAFIIHQLKRPEEVKLLRNVYSKQFILVSAYGELSSRKLFLERKLKRSLSTLLPDSQISARADELIERDAMEEGQFGGQQLRETFHLGDVFIDGVSRKNMDEMLERFVQAFFGRTDCAPNKHEFGMYAAKSASLRSADLSRQVGAAIFTQEGELVTQGCNEVARAFGGTYWDQEEPDNRDVKVGHDPNDDLRRELMRDLFERLLKADMLSDKAKGFGSPAAIVAKLTGKVKQSDGNVSVGPLASASIMDLTEFGRVVHAEMCAICDAARLGRSLKGTTLYCTTFPCHNCSKHILAVGIRKVVYMEPYPKSKTRELFKNEIAIETESDDKVAFVPFLGISPFRYRDIFQKGKRKDGDGRARRWYADGEKKKPMIDVFGSSYIEELELLAVAPLIGEWKPAEAS